jgi:glutamate synthase domain-containing protein 2
MDDKPVKARYDIPRQVIQPLIKSSKFKISEKADYVHPGQAGFDDFSPRENYWTAQVISRLHFQAETGRIPVSGCGYGGPFAGRGFDAIWFDMSEIVRPTRDGIHGREYISTTVDLGRKLGRLEFHSNGALRSKVPTTVFIPFPVLFNHLPFKLLATGAQMAILKAAEFLGTLAVIPQGHCTPEFMPYAGNIILRLHEKPNGGEAKLISKGRVVEIKYGTKFRGIRDAVRTLNPSIICSVRLKARKGVERKVVKLAREGAGIIHLSFDYYGVDEDGRLLPDVLRQVHMSLVDEGIRNQVSLIVSGGIAAAEHVAKSVICGADAVEIDYALLAALGCSLWADVTHPCPVEHSQVQPELGSKRIINLMAAWRNQLLEILGAMGIREVRRMRGEVGRAIFADEEEEIFRKLFKASKKLKYHPPLEESLAGDCRWPFWLLRATSQMSTTGKVPGEGGYRVGASGGGFDRLAFVFELDGVELEDDKSIDLSIQLNKRGIGREINLPMPVYSGGMSFGSVSLNVMLARAMAAKELDSFLCTGEGGYPKELLPYKDHIITQIATGLFGVNEETIQLSRIVEFKYAQGAKPGLGGHLLGGKVTEAVATARESVPGKSLFSPFPFHSVYSVEDHKKHVDWVLDVNPDALVIVKVSTPLDVDMVAVGSYYAGAHIINIDGSYGSTGAAPDISKKNIALPVEYAIPKVHGFLEQEGVRDEVTLIASGGVRTAYDIAKSIALGADGAMVGAADLVALGCERLGVCEKGDGCPLGLTTTNEKKAAQLDPVEGAKRIVNLRRAWAVQLRQILNELDMKDVRELRGRTDTLRYLNEVKT